MAANVELPSTHEGTVRVLALAAGDKMEQCLARGCPDKPSSPRAGQEQLIVPAGYRALRETVTGPQRSNPGPL